VAGKFLDIDYTPGIAHLRAVDPRMRQIIDGVGPELRPLRRSLSLFAHLTRVIVGQQVSTKAAESIWRRILATIGSPLRPSVVLQEGHDVLRSCGCSGRKADYILELAARVSDGRLPVGGWHRRSDEEIYQRLVELPGIGPWTVEMCLMFRFGRRDVFSPADIGIRRAMEKAYDLPLGLKEKAWRQLSAEISEPWRPWRTVACRFLWKAFDADFSYED
jgi:DNA-3-methyladenine glycosylase II